MGSQTGLLPLNTNNILVGLGWDEARLSLLEQVGSFVGLGVKHLFRRRNLLGQIQGIVDDYSGKSEGMDLGPDLLNLDLSLLVFGEDDHLYSSDPNRSFVYNYNLKLFGAIQHHGDNRTGGGEGCDEYITIHLDLLPQDVAKLVAVVNITDHMNKGQDFSMCGHAYVTLVDFAKGKEVDTLLLNKGSKRHEAGLTAYSIERQGSSWGYRRIDETFARVEDPMGIFNRYTKVSVDNALQEAIGQMRRHRLR